MPTAQACEVNQDMADGFVIETVVTYLREAGTPRLKREGREVAEDKLSKALARCSRV